MVKPIPDRTGKLAISDPLPAGSDGNGKASIRGGARRELTTEKRNLFRSKRLPRSCLAEAPSTE
tara:strand:+ start:1702 stop:1893 length:192 start_codon:yes stop_codon:yes gene_type:complete